MLPQLLRFYGGTPRTWAETPYAVAIACYDAIPQLEAQENLVALDVAALAAHSKVEPQDYRSIVGGWKRDARGSQPKPKLSREQRRHILASVGIAYEEVPKRGG